MALAYCGVVGDERCVSCITFCIRVIIVRKGCLGLVNCCAGRIMLLSHVQAPDVPPTCMSQSNNTHLQALLMLVYSRSYNVKYTGVRNNSMPK